jgi:hypothetical protein
VKSGQPVSRLGSAATRAASSGGATEAGGGLTHFSQPCGEKPMMLGTLPLDDVPSRAASSAPCARLEPQRIGRTTQRMTRRCETIRLSVRYLIATATAHSKP